MKTLTELSRLNRGQLEEAVKAYSYMELIDTLYLALKKRDCNKITLTRRQFEEHFQFSQETLRRGRPRMNEEEND